MHLPVMKRKRACTQDADLPASESERRRLQRERQQVAYAMRSQGSAYVKSSAIKAPQVKAKSKTSKAGKRQRPTSPPFQVAIIAIFWNQRAMEKKVVLKKCEEVETLLQNENVACHIDCNSKYTPGQRMRHWEEKGVKVRIELGPKDAEQNTCMVARSQAIPGKVAHKRTSEIGSEMCSSVKEMLQLPDNAVPEGSLEKYEAKKQEKTSKKIKATLSVKVVKTVDKQTAAGGDDLEDDFGSI